MTSSHFPTEIKRHQKSRVMEIAFSDGRSFRHGPGGENQDKLWAQYLARLEQAGASRE